MTILWPWCSWAWWADPWTRGAAAGWGYPSQNCSLKSKVLFPYWRYYFYWWKKLSLNIFYIIRTWSNFFCLLGGGEGSFISLARGRATIGIFFLKTVPWKAKFFSPTVNQHWRYYFYWWKKLYFHFFVSLEREATFFCLLGSLIFFGEGKGYHKNP